MNTKNFKRLIALKGTTLEAIANVLGIDRSTLYRKLRFGTDGLTVSEAIRIARFLHLSTDEEMDYFWHKSCAEAGEMSVWH